MLFPEGNNEFKPDMLEQIRGRSLAEMSAILKRYDAKGIESMMRSGFSKSEALGLDPLRVMLPPELNTSDEREWQM